jgi:hypothetical protein
VAPTTTAPARLTFGDAAAFFTAFLALAAPRDAALVVLFAALLTADLARASVRLAPRFTLLTVRAVFRLARFNERVAVRFTCFALLDLAAIVPPELWQA